MPTRASTPRQPTHSGASAEQRVRRSVAALRVGATTFAALCGVACYVVLGQFAVTGVGTAIAGFAFALLVRVAALSIGRDWLLTAARRHAASPPAGAAPPTVPPTVRPSHRQRR